LITTLISFIIKKLKKEKIMDLFEAINKRHSYRDKFKDIKIPEEDLKKIITAGIKAPSGCNAQTTDFVIVNNINLIHEIAEILQKELIKTAQAIIVCITDIVPVYHGMSFQKEDCAAATENLLLAITALGYATVWIDGALRREQKAEKIKELLKVPDNKTVQIVLPVGVPETEKQQKEKKRFNERAWFNSYNKK
jgi:nitroreductase